LRLINELNSLPLSLSAISITGSILLKPAYMMHSSYSAEKILPSNTRRTWLSWELLISRPY